MQDSLCGECNSASGRNADWRNEPLKLTRVGQIVEPIYNLVAGSYMERGLAL